MNALIPAVLEGELLSPSDCVRVIGRAHPLSGARIDRQLPAGMSIAEILRECAGSYGGGFAVYLGEHPISPDHYGRIRLKAGATVTFMPRLGGNTLKTVFSLVLVVAAMVVAPWIAGPALLGLTGTALSVGTALIAGGIMLAGSLAMNALFPTRVADQKSDGVNARSLISIQGAQNQANLFGSVPVVLGRHRISPFYAAKPYTEIVGSDQWLRLLFCVGYGPMSLSEFKIGETALETYAGTYQLEVKQGFVGDTGVSLYPGDVTENALAITLDPGVPHTQTSADETDQISIDLTAAQGIVAYNTQGTKMPRSVLIVVEYRAVGAGTFSPWANVTMPRSDDPVRQGLALAVPRGQYEVRVTRSTPLGDPQYVHDECTWTALRSFKNEAPVDFPKPLTLIGLRIKATDQLSGVVNTLNCVATSLVKAYSGSGSVWNNNTASQNPADLFRHVLQGPANARPVADALINISNLQAWWAYCVSKGFRYNEVISSVGSVYDKLCDIAASGRAVPTFTNGQWDVVWDRPGDSIVQVFTPRNSWGLQLMRPYAQQPHGWRVSFVNEDNGYTQDERIVYDDGFDESNASLFEGMQFPGVTDPDLIWKHGRFHIAQSRMRPEKVTINVGWENLVCTRGDRVSLTHDVMLIGLASGRVKSIAGQVVTFDETLTLLSSKTYGAQFRVPEDARVLTRAVDMSGVVSGDYTTLTLVGDLSGVRPGQLFVFGETARASANYRVQAIQHQKDLVATLTLVDDAPDLVFADSGAIPVYSPNITIPPDPFTLPVRDLRYVEVIDGQGAQVRALVRLTWQVPRFGRISYFEIQKRDDDASTIWVAVPSVVPPHTSADVPLAAPGTWSFRVRCVFDDATVSEWVELERLALLALSQPPAPVANLRATFISGRSCLSWDSPSDPRQVLVEIRKGASFEAAQIVEDVATSPWLTVGDDLYFVTTYVVSPFNTRVYSSPLQSINITGSVATENVVVGHDERADGWLGTFEGTVGIDTGGNFLRTSAGDFLGTTNFLTQTNFLDSDGVQTGGYYWSPTVVNTGGVTFCRVSNDWTATGVPQDADFLGTPDFLEQPDFVQAYLSQYVRVRPVIRVSQVGPTPTWGPVQVWSPDVYQGWMFQLGIQFEILTDIVPDPRVIAYLLSWSWQIDVPDRLDSYQNLTVPVGGLVINFRPVGATVDKAFAGGLNNAPLPHITPSIRNPSPGYQVVWTGLSLSQVTVKVLNGSGTDVGGSEVNVLAYGY